MSLVRRLPPRRPSHRGIEPSKILPPAQTRSLALSVRITIPTISCYSSTEFHLRNFSTNILQSLDGNRGEDLFSKLPGELQNQIFENLDYPSAIFLARTNRHLRRVIKPSSAPTDAEKLSYLFCLEKLEENAHRYACSSCLRLKCCPEFGETQIMKKRSKSHCEAHLRLCIECALKRRFYSPGTRVRIRGMDGKRQDSYLWKCRCKSLLQRGPRCEVCSLCEFCGQYGVRQRGAMFCKCDTYPDPRSLRASNAEDPSRIADASDARVLTWDNYEDQERFRRPVEHGYDSDMSSLF
ncbi:hypothetical protein IWX90DRAFT_429594 [Phyllosticta citrichinensis]|uniref:F-box domain-containing protein n=1 Tax=Phyllosticta citrichinensis TaxID=1130410 RepID=A0ABR1XV70_9PEZI